MGSQLAFEKRGGCSLFKSFKSKLGYFSKNWRGLNTAFENSNENLHK